MSLEEIEPKAFKRSSSSNLSDNADDIQTINILYALDGKRSVLKISSEKGYDLDEFKAGIESLYAQGLIEPVIQIISVGGDLYPLTS